MLNLTAVKAKYKVVESAAVRDFVEDNRSVKLLKEVYEGMKWIAAREPQSGSRLFGEVYVMGSPRYGRFEIPTLSMLYEIEGETVRVVMVQIEAEG